eukprot:1015211-Rhodomonas_salina.1
MPGTDIAYEVPDIAYETLMMLSAGPVLRWRMVLPAYAMCSTGIVHAAIRLCGARELEGALAAHAEREGAPPISLRPSWLWCYVMSGTKMGYGATE